MILHPLIQAIEVRSDGTRLGLFSRDRMMWKANKTGILTLLGGFAVLGVAFASLQGESPQLARQVVAVGVCILLFGVGLGSWLSVRREIKRHRNRRCTMDDVEN